MGEQKLGIRVSDEFMEKIEKTAEAHVQSRAGIGMMGLELMTGFDVDFYKQIEAAAKNLNVPTWLFIQNKLIKEMARYAAMREVHPEGGELLPEFAFTSDGPITGKRLFDMLRDQFIQEEKQKLIEKK
ncbi:MAG: hypothetical protein SCK57_08160 [Bacillota bacterium]|nr:hypothetical protein [Bacillota bacterium]MDW7677620.1 hypothetical protein [Bacillota bacterium]